MARMADWFVGDFGNPDTAFCPFCGQALEGSGSSIHDRDGLRIGVILLCDCAEGSLGHFELGFGEDEPRFVTGSDELLGLER